MQYCCADRSSTTGSFLKENFPTLYESYFSAVDAIVPKIQRLLDYFRKTRRPIVFTTVSSNLPSGLDFDAQRRGRELKYDSDIAWKSVITYRGRPDAQIIRNVSPTESDLVVNKVSLSAFSSSGIDQLLTNMEIDALVFCGVVTNGCVMANAIDASERGYRTVVVEDACAALDSFLHETALFHMGHLHGRVLGTDEVLRELNEAITRASKPGKVALSAQAPSKDT
jgi:nicotinamidase-related amidase